MPAGKILMVVIAFVIIFQFSSCSNDGISDNYVNFDISSEPQNLDPPLAIDSASKLVVTNLFEGLLRMTADGKLTEGVATTYDVSADGLTYTFHLRQNAQWSNKTPVTAKDFVYGFRRLCDPHTGSDAAKDFYSIKNAEAVHTGVLSADQIGVTAIDDYTLQIALSYRNPSILVLLTTPPAMPCNEEYFVSCKGRYGLSPDSLITNGAYALYDWTKGKSLTLLRNKYYHSATPVKNGGVHLYIQSDAKQTQQDFLSGNIDAVLAGGDQISNYLSKGYNIDEIAGSVCGIVFNQKSSLLTNGNLLSALTYDLDRASYANYLPKYLTVSNTIIPPAITILDKPYRDLAKEAIAPDYQKDLAQQYMSTAYAQLGVSSITDLSLIVPKNSAYADLFAYASQIWQRDLKVYFKVQVLEQNEYDARVKSGDYDCAIVGITGSYNSPEAFLSQFEGLQQAGLTYPGLSDLLVSASRSDSAASAEYYKQAEELILNSHTFLPLFNQISYFVSNPSVSGFIHDISGAVIDFKNCTL